MEQSKTVRHLDFCANDSSLNLNLNLNLSLQSNTTVVSPPRVGPRFDHALHSYGKTESPNTRERRKLEQRDGTPKKRKQCNCKSTSCLKLYCECFAAGLLCEGCNCKNCHNNIEHDAERKLAVETYLEKDSNTFRSKVVTSPGGNIDGGVEHNKGCNCKKTGCLKKYCECFQANVTCSDKCKCLDCKNIEGSEARNVRFHEHQTNSMISMHQVANAAINGATGTVREQIRQPYSSVGVTSKRKATSRHGQQRQNQEVRLTSDSPYSPTSVHQSKLARAKSLGPSKSPYRSQLNRLLQPQDVKDLCTRLVEVSAEAAKTLTEKCNDTDTNKATTSSGSLCDDSKRNQSHASMGWSEDQGSIRSSSQYERPLSPGTLALMCDEPCAMFATADSTSTVTESDTSNESGSRLGQNKLYIEQERLVLTNFCSFLNKLIIRSGVQGDDDMSYS